MINFDTIIMRMVEIIKYNDIDADNDILRSVRYGESDNVDDLPKPFCLVTTTDSPFETDQEFGTSVVNNDIQNTLTLQIKIFVQGKDSATAEKKLYKQIKKLTDIIRKNPRLAAPDNFSDPLSIRSVIIAPLEINNRNTENPSATLTLKLQQGSQIQIRLAGITNTLNVLEEGGGSNAGWETAQRADDDGQTDEVQTTYREVKYYLIEITTAIETQLRTILQNGGPLSTQIFDGSTVRNVMCMLNNMSIVHEYDKLKMATIELRVLKN